jgi:hypothetical protein
MVFDLDKNIIIYPDNEGRWHVDIYLNKHNFRATFEGPSAERRAFDYKGLISIAIRDGHRVGQVFKD